MSKAEIVKGPLVLPSNETISAGDLALRLRAYATTSEVQTEFDLGALTRDFIILARLAGMQKEVWLLSLAGAWDDLITSLDKEGMN